MSEDVISVLFRALKRLTFAARSSGGTAGPDAHLMLRCDEAEALLSRYSPLVPGETIADGDSKAGED